MLITAGGLKGGLGKSTTCWYLGAGLARLGRTLVVDADPASQSLFGWACRAIDAGHELPFTVQPWSTPDLGRKLRTVLADFDHVVVDTGGETTRLFEEAIKVTQNLIIPCAPNVAEIERLPATLTAAAEAEEVLGEPITARILLVRVDGRARDGADARTALLTRGWPVMAAVVRDSVEYSRAPGIIPTDLGDYAAVLDELLTAQAVDDDATVLGGAA